MTYEQLRSDLDYQIRLVRERLEFHKEMYNKSCLAVDDAIHNDLLDMSEFRDLVSRRECCFFRMKECEDLLGMLEEI